MTEHAPTSELSPKQRFISLFDTYCGEAQTAELAIYSEESTPLALFDRLKLQMDTDMLEATGEQDNLYQLTITMSGRQVFGHATPDHETLGLLLFTTSTADRVTGLLSSGRDVPVDAAYVENLVNYVYENDAAGNITRL